MTTGLKAGTVKLASYSSSWARRFASEKRRLLLYLPARGLRIEHIGSTAVPGLDAKPIIDIAVSVTSLKRLTAFIEALARARYTYKGEYGLTGRHFFVRGDPVTHHLHIVLSSSKHWTAWLAFRDYLRAHPEEAAAYNAFKRDLARRYASDRDAYTKAKTPFIAAMLRKAMKNYKIQQHHH
jgi:GrpB-like predicted nucleotidyltransferase (UPF0157 family)